MKRKTSEREDKLLVKLCHDNPMKNECGNGKELYVKCSVTITKE